jgi:hypothetical protein
MALQVFVFLLVVCLFLSLALLWCLNWFQLRLSSSPGGAKRSTFRRLLKPRSPDDCPICRLASPNLGSASAPVRPWREVKSPRGAPKRVNTEGFACPNLQCAYFGITEAHIHALVGDGKHGHAERIQTFRGPACHTTFTARRHTPLYRLKTPSQQVAVVLSALAEGLDASAAERVFGYRQAAITSWLTRAGKHAETFHQRCFRNLHIPHLQLDEIRTRLRRSTQVLWLWLAVDPLTKILPVLELGPRTQNMAHLLVHSLRQRLAPGCLPLFTSDGLNVYFYALTAHFVYWRQMSCRGRRGQKTAGGGRADLWSSEENLSAAQAGARQAGDAPGHTDSSSSHLAGVRLLGTAEYCFHRAGESDGPPWNSRAGASHLGDCSAVPIPARTPGMVASVLPFCASSPIPAPRGCTRRPGKRFGEAKSEAGNVVQ